MSQQCANPLLRDWVKEWMDSAQSLQSKSYYTYKKVDMSLIVSYTLLYLHLHRLMIHYVVALLRSNTRLNLNNLKALEK